MRYHHSLASLLVLSALRPSAALAQAAPPALHVLAAPREVTASRRPVFAGISDPGASVLLTVDGHRLGRATANRHGQWSFVTPVDLREGEHHVAFALDDPRARTMPAVVRAVSVTACTDSRACEGATPVCDAGSARCRACTFDAECGDPAHPRCSERGPSRGMCVAQPPALTIPADGHAIGPMERTVQGRGRPYGEVVVFVDGVEATRVSVDGRGRFSAELLGFDRGWHNLSAANVDDGVLGPEGAVTHVLAAACVHDDDCRTTERCDMLRLACERR